MSKKESVKHEIQQLATGNYKSFPEEYIDIATEEAEENIRSLAKGYWDSRSEKEITRDDRLGLHLEDYTQWAHEALEKFLQENQGSLN